MIFTIVKTICVRPPQRTPHRLTKAKPAMAAAPQAVAVTPAGATANCVANSPRTMATPATDPGPLTHISIQILTKAGKGPNPSRMMW